MKTNVKHYVLSETTIDEIAGTRLPFTSKKYYGFTDKYLPDGVDEELYIDDNTTYYREIITEYDDLKYLSWLSSFFTEPVLCDIGCGIGNILFFASKFGYSAFGYDINSMLLPVHRKLKADVVYGDLLDMDLSRMMAAEVIYLYRPIEDKKLMDRVFELIFANTKEDVIIVYNYPHSKKVPGFDTVVLSRFDEHLVMLVKQSGRMLKRIKPYCRK